MTYVLITRIRFRVDSVYVINKLLSGGNKIIASVLLWDVNRVSLGNM